MNLVIHSQNYWEWIWNFLILALLFCKLDEIFQMSFNKSDILPSLFLRNMQLRTYMCRICCCTCASVLQSVYSNIVSFTFEVYGRVRISLWGLPQWWTDSGRVERVKLFLLLMCPKQFLIDEAVCGIMHALCLVLR